MTDATRRTEISCRLARTRDAHLLARMSRDYIETDLGWSWRANRIDRFIQAPDSVVVCAEQRQDVTSKPCTLYGFAIMEFDLDKAHLNLLAVAPAARRQGIARMLLGWLERSAEVAGTYTIDLEVRATNVAAQQFYAALGYQLKRTLPGYYNGRETAYHFQKRLFDARGDTTQS